MHAGRGASAATAFALPVRARAGGLQSAIEGGLRVGYTAAGAARQRRVAARDAGHRAAREGARDATRLDREAMGEASGYFEWLTVREGKPRGEVAQYDQALYEHQVPGGMISNLKSPARDDAHGGAACRQILEEAAQVRRDLGYPILVSPFAQYIVTQAVLNVVQGERYKTIPDEVRKYACGYYGRLAAEPAGGFLSARASGRGEMVTERAAPHIAPGCRGCARRSGAARATRTCCCSVLRREAARAACKCMRPRCSFRTSPLHELIRYLGTRSDISHARIRFAGADISLSA